MDYGDAVTTNVLSPDTLPVGDLRNMLRHIESELPSTMHLPISSDNTLHFYWYLNTHLLLGDGQCLLLINMPVQNREQLLQICGIFSLLVPHSNLSAEYKVNYKYIWVTYDETKAVAITDLQYRACQHANGQFYRINAPFQSPTNLPSCVTALYTKKDQAIKRQCSLIISHMPHTYVPIAVTSNLWIIPLNPQTWGLTMTIIYPDKTTSTVPLQQPFHILRLSVHAVLHQIIFTCPHIIRITLW